MNLPENLSAAAKKVYALLSNSQSPKSLEAITSEYGTQSTGEEGYKAIATADSLVAKGIITPETGEGKSTSQSNDFYILVKGLGDVGPSEEADANEDYAKKTDANEEEKRMITILEAHGKRLPATELFDLYMKGQMPENNTSAPDGELTTSLQELEDAGLITKEGETYQVKS